MMPKTTIRLGRKYQTWRISAYECETNSSGIPTKKGRYIGRGWYGLFDDNILKREIMPKLNEYTSQGWSYPFLITKHRLEKEARIDVIPPRTIKYHPRKKQSEKTWVAVVTGPKDLKKLTEN
jgi:hypothetical protein